MPRPISTLSPGPVAGRGSDASVVEAREALAYWRRREAELPWHRRAARAEARDMAMRARRRLVIARFERWSFVPSGLLAPAVTALVLPRRQQARRLLALALRTGIGRRLRLMAIAASAAALTAVAIVGVVATQLL
jgi:hypothetical protein